MINFDNIWHKYINEQYTSLAGLYSFSDEKMLYAFIREYKPKNILDVAPREGKTTSTILAALLKNAEEDNGEINYYIFEKDKEYYNNILSHMNLCKQKFDELGVCLHIHSDENLIDSNLLKHDIQLDLAFIDANHDYILSRYIFDNVINRVKVGGYMHFHDMHVNRNGNGLADIKLINDGCHHEDVINEDIHKKLYPSIFEKYKENYPIHIFEGDIVYDYITKNNVPYFSTKTLKGNNNDAFNCSLYIQKVNIFQNAP